MPADMPSSSDTAPPVERFWSVNAEPVASDVSYFNWPVWNAGLVSVAPLLHVGAGYADVEPPSDVAERLGR